MEFTASEADAQDALLAALALLRANVNGDDEGITAILDTAGDREARAIAGVLTGIAGDLVVRLTVAHGLLEDEDRELVRTASVDALAAAPEMRAAVEENIAATQASVIREH